MGKKAQEAAQLAAKPRKAPIDWTTYNVDEHLEGEDADLHARIQHLTLTTGQLRSHCQTLEVENASLKDLMADFDFNLGLHAEMIGHINHKQKIRYTLQLKDTINRLLEELRRARQRIFRLEEARVDVEEDYLSSPVSKAWKVSESSVTTMTTTVT